MKSTETAKSVNISQLKSTFARESAQLDTHSKIQFVFQNVCQDSETIPSVVVLNSVLLLDAASLTSINKDHVSVNVTLDHIQTQPIEFVRLAARTVSHAFHPLIVSAAVQVST